MTPGAAGLSAALAVSHASLKAAIGPALSFGYIAAQHAASAAP
jgi:hypothetical protein